LYFNKFFMNLSYWEEDEDSYDVNCINFIYKAFYITL
jgi:hypothetical protein